jgi:MFS-type transporter involved in bile tolerance (Atg22 family)
MTDSISNQSLSLELFSKLQVLVDKVKTTLDQNKSVAISKAWGILQIATAEVIQVIEDNNPLLKGSNKKEIALSMISTFYDKVFLVISIPFIPVVLQPIIQKYIKALLMLLVSSTIDSMVEIFRKTGIFPDPNTIVDPDVDNVPKVSEK